MSLPLLTRSHCSPAPSGQSQAFCIWHSRLHPLCPHQASPLGNQNLTEYPTNSQSHHFTSAPPPCLCRSHPAVWIAPPPPRPAKGSHEGSEVGSEAVS